jgi:DNA-binding XRE family transcriptional regulator
MTKYSWEYTRKMSKKWNKEIEKKVMYYPELRDMYNRKHHEIDIALLMRRTREKANLSQEDVASRMHTTRSSVSRLESSGTGRHSPSLDTLLKYAQALGYAVKIQLVPTKEQ